MLRATSCNAPPYLADNICRILTCEQQLPPIPSNYDKFKANSGVKFVIDKGCSNKSIERKDVIKLYEQPDLTTAVIGTMIWGLMSTRFGHFQRMLAAEEKALRLERVRGLVEANDIRGAFESMQYKGLNSIAGIGYAYFTKIFYLIGQVSLKVSPKPLILDKWTQNAYCALLVQIDKKKAAELFLIDSSGNAKPKSSRLVDCYLSYIRDMHDWALELCRFFKVSIDSASLEMFVFGTNLRTDSNNTNPRQELRKILLSVNW